MTLLNVSPSGTFRRADWASVADAAQGRSGGEVGLVPGQSCKKAAGNGGYRELEKSEQGQCVERHAQQAGVGVGVEVPDDVVCEMARVQQGRLFRDIRALLAQPCLV